MDTGSRARQFAVLSVAAVVAVSLACAAPSTSVASSRRALGGSSITLAQNVVIPLRVVNRFFSEIIRRADTGRNPTATNNPKATRMVIYANGDASKKVTITLDQYDSPSAASSAYQQAVRKSRAVPGFRAIKASSLGQQAFAGTVTMDEETHLGLGTLDGSLVVGATLAGYPATPENVAKLVTLARRQDAAAKMALGNLVDRGRS